MPIQETEVVVGGIYEAGNNQQRKVTKIKDGKVFYSSRGGNVKNDWAPGHTLANPPSIKTFADACSKKLS